MAVSMARSASAGVVRGAAQRSAAVRPTVSKAAAPRLPIQRTAGPVSTTSKVATKVAAVEVAQLAGEAGFITGTALTMVAMTLLGLAVGFVLLRVEALVEEGKL